MEISIKLGAIHRARELLKPRIKPEHVPFRTFDGNVRIAATIHGIGAEMEDSGGWLWTLVSALDGTRSPDDVLAVVTCEHPEVSEIEATEAMQQLLEAGFLEEFGACPPAQLSRPPKCAGRSKRTASPARTYSACPNTRSAPGPAGTGT
ncbi:hypothetical protein [Nonomuraea sp. NPDC050643]|uniref:hypothetical protein n=1 Tax=Nonomuraea sp. NPDC050643 TaxID=3155660 RepID=UPI0033D6EF57